ncbi:DUF1652 domain-containing protein [Pseudomonas sp.]|jgi:hypothetical protein|uniref:DUF1652 domain-containing protein n=1 Tax=Pseudomonas sp. TaxID=306 RepID=UPI0028A80A79|nr:DUF1652 domain-containing protein [Pseudomonas sp.]
MPTRFEAARTLIESSFTPFNCQITLERDSFSVRIHDTADDTTHLVVTGIPLFKLDTPSGAQQVVEDIRSELAMTRLSAPNTLSPF